MRLPRPRQSSAAHGFLSQLQSDPKCVSVAGSEFPDSCAAWQGSVQFLRYIKSATLDSRTKGRGTARCPLSRERHSLGVRAPSFQLAKSRFLIVGHFALSNL